MDFLLLWGRWVSFLLYSATIHFEWMTYALSVRKLSVENHTIPYVEDKLSGQNWVSKNIRSIMRRRHVLGTKCRTVHWGHVVENERGKPYHTMHGVYVIGTEHLKTIPYHTMRTRCCRYKTVCRKPFRTIHWGHIVGTKLSVEYHTMQHIE